MALNRPRTEEEKRHQSEVMKGRAKTPETRAKISASMKRYHSEHPSTLQPRIDGLRNYHNRAKELISRYGMNDEN